MCGALLDFQEPTIAPGADDTLGPLCEPICEGLEDGLTIGRIFGRFQRIQADKDFSRISTSPWAVS